MRLAVLVILVVAAAAHPSRASAQRNEGQAPARPLVEALRAIYRQPAYTVFDWIGGRYDRGTLTLEGFAARPALREQAQKVARSTAGVDEIVNGIEVLPALPSDDTLRLLLYAAIYGHPALERYLPGGGATGSTIREMETAGHFGIESSSQFREPHPIHIVVSAGMVQLFGSVPSTGDRQIAEMQARTTMGVVNVVNRIQVRR